MTQEIEKIVLLNLKTAKISPKTKIIIAVSGGIDSMCLLHILIKNNFKPIVCHVEHGIRGKTSKKDAIFVKNICDKNNLTFEITELNLKKISNKKSFETISRELRYDFYRRIATKHKAKKVLLAHHLNDSLETFLINITRGTGIKGLLGIPQNREIFLRPMSKITKKDIIKYAKLEKIKFKEDITNKDTKYTRNRIRINVIPQLEKINPCLLESFKNSQEILYNLYNYIQEESKKWIKKNLKFNESKNIAHIPLSKFNKLNISLKSQIIYDIYLELENRIISNKLIKDILEIINKGVTGKQKSFGSKVIILSHNKINILSKKKQKPLTLKIEYLKNKPSNLKSEKYLYIDANKIKKKLSQRSIKAGDKFIPFGMKGHQKIQDFLVNKKIPAFERTSLPLLTDGKIIVAISNLAINDLYKVTEKTQTVIKLSIS